MTKQGWWRWSLLVAVAMVTVAVVWFLPTPWSILLLIGLGSAVLLGTLLLSPAPRWTQDSFWQNNPMVDRLRSRSHARWRRWRPTLAVLASVAVLTGVVLLVWLVPPALYQHVGNEQARVSAEASTRTGLIAGLAGLTALGGLVFTARNVQINRQTLEATQQVQTETLRLTEQGHITERYTKAIEQLGNKGSLDVRLGGIYALERIAVDSKRDHPTVVEVLAAFIRTSSQPTTSSNRSPDNQSNAQPKEQPASAALPAGDTRRSLPFDVQAAVTVLGRLRSRDGVSREDLSGAQLAGARLIRANLAGARFREAILADADLGGANLVRAEFPRADLTDAILTVANLTGAQLGGADLTGAQLGETDLTAPGSVRRT